MRLILVFLFAALTASPQIFSVGVKGGVPLTDAFETATTGHLSYLSSTKRYTVGPTVEVRLPFRLSVEFDALYKRLDYDSASMGVDTFVRSATTSNSWEFPLLAKWRLFGGPVRPFVDAGPTFNKLSGISQSIQTLVAPDHLFSSSSNRPSELQNTFRAGVAVGGGIEFGAHHFRISPEVRYTRWGTENFRSLTSSDLLHSNDNQAEFLLGITF
jgi:hypothetical protein